MKVVFKSTDWIDAVAVDRSVLYSDSNYGAASSAVFLVNGNLDTQSLSLIDRKDIAAQTGREYKNLHHYMVARGLVDGNSDTSDDFNLDDAFAVASIFDQLEGDGVLLLHTLDVVADPKVILRALRGYLLEGASRHAVLTGSIFNESLGLREGRYREWGLSAIIAFLKSSGFTVDRAGMLGHEWLLEVSASRETLKKVRVDYGLPEDASVIIATTEHADTRSTGGIGSYVKEVEQVLGYDDLPLVLYCGERHFVDDSSVETPPVNMVDVRDIIPSYQSFNSIEIPSVAWDIYRAIDWLIFLYDEVSLVEYQDWNGMGARLVEAKKAGMIPKSITLRVRCHGNHVYTERAMKRWVGLEEADHMLLEKVSVEQADEVSFPTRYLERLYIETGYDLSHTKVLYERLPYRYPSEVQSASYGSVDTLIFIGKRSSMKGYPDFVRAVEALIDPNSPQYNVSIKNIIVYGGRDPYGECDSYDEILRAYSRTGTIDVTIDIVSRAQVLSTLRRYHTSGIAILPYTADNHPVAVLEMIANYFPFIAYSTGGIPELFASGFHKYFLAPYGHRGLAEKIQGLSGLDADRRKDIMAEVFADSYEEQIRINKQVKQSYLPNISKNVIVPHLKELSAKVSVMIPVYNKDLRYINELINGLNAQILQPANVIIVDDGSEKSYSKDLIGVLKQIRAPYDFIRQENKGLAGARNTALRACKTEYLINIDADDIPLPQFIYDYVTILERSPQFDVAITCLEAIPDTFTNKRPAEHGYRYVGIGGSPVLALHKNLFGHASSIVRVEAARNIGGWDDTDRTKWEDWQFYMKLTARGGQIFNSPKVNYLYRVADNSMVRSADAYPDYFAELRIARTLIGEKLSTWDAWRLYSITHRDTHVSADDFSALSGLTVRAAMKIQALMHGNRYIHKAGRVLLQGARKARRVVGYR